MPKTLAELLAEVEVDPDQIRGGPAEILSVVSDSRKVTAGSCFVAIRGFTTDGHEYIGKAIDAGATAVVYENPAFASAIPPSVASAQVADSRKACATMSVAFWDSPSSELTVVGVTGTNGKTTSVAAVEALCRGHGYATGTLGTLGQSVGDAAEPTSHTTLDSVDLQAALAGMRERGVTHVAMEVSSHALALDRTWGMKFDVVAFTNLSPDHLDFFDSMRACLDAKARLFTEYPEFSRPEKELQAVINASDAAGRELLARATCPTISYGLADTASAAPEVSARNVECSSSGARFDLCAREDVERVELALMGRFNIMNALCAAGCGLALGMSVAEIARHLAGVPGVPGRFERVDEGQDFSVAIDYAHSPDGVLNILTSAREITEKRLICVLGCGGDRQRTKRPMMASIAEEHADVVIVTSDNPRSEDPQAIIDEMLTGIRGQNAEVRVEPDRRRAIELAVSLCEPGDMLIIAGKGHETCQIFADETIHFDDREEARRAIRARLERERS